MRLYELTGEERKRDKMALIDSKDRFENHFKDIEELSHKRDELRTQILELYRALPKQFEADLAFKQLTGT